MRRKTLSLLTGLAALALASALYAFPVAAAVLCPPCLGMERIAPGLIVERGLPARERDIIRTYRDIAADRVQSRLGPPPAFMTIVACQTDTCQASIGQNGPRGVTYALPGIALIQLSPKGGNPVIMSHEISHATLRSRAGWWLDYPQWFDEGLAVVISQDPRFLTTTTDPGTCIFDPRSDLPETLADWQKAAGDRSRVIYGEAACAVRHWLDDNGGYDALQDVIAAARAGQRSLP